MSRRIFTRNGLEVTSFYGGRDRGACLALDMDRPVVLTAQDVEDLRAELAGWLASIAAPATEDRA